MAVPARHIPRPLALKQLILHYEVFENLVQRMPWQETENIASASAQDKGLGDLVGT